MVRKATAALGKILSGRFGESFHDPKTWFGLDEPSANLGLPGDFYSRLNRGFYGKSLHRGWILLFDLTKEIELDASSRTGGSFEDMLIVDDALQGKMVSGGDTDSDVANITFNDELKAGTFSSGDPKDEMIDVSSV